MRSYSRAEETLRVLVIEDDPLLRASIEDALDDAGHEVRTACDGAEALAYLEERAAWIDPDELPEVIVLDLMMPNMSGELFRIHQLSDVRIADIPTLVITAKVLTRGAQDALGELPVLRKPFALTKLLEAIGELAAPVKYEPKRCACGHAYDDQEWHTLRLLGEIDNGRGLGERFELRQCSWCHSTIAWELGRHSISVPCPD
jgi:two-component system response regulator MprA